MTAGVESDAIVATLDVMPTFAALAGGSGTVPTDRVIDGVDQRDLFFGKSEEGNRNEFLYFESEELQAVRQGSWKLRLPNLQKVRNWPEVDRGSQEAELYHIAKDIGEKRNVAEKWPKGVERLTKLAEESQPDAENSPIGL